MVQISNNIAKNIKLLLITHYYPKHRGGIEIVAGKLAEYLLGNENLQITWMASNVDSPPEKIPRLRCLPMTSLNVMEDKINLPYPLWSLSSLCKLWQVIGTVDVIHFHDYLYMGNLAAFLFAKIQQKPIVITQHIGFIPYENPLLRNLLSFLNQSLGCFILRHAHQVVFISEVVQKYFASKTRFRHLPQMIPNGVDTQTFFPAQEQERKLIRQQLGLPLEKPLFLFVGRFVEKKGLTILKQLAVRFHEVHWALAGWGTIDPQLWNLPNVEVFRDRREKQLTPLYQAADLLVLPSKGEGFPLVVQEAMACGTPVMIGRETAEGYSAAQQLMFSEAVDSKDAVTRWTEKLEHILQENSTLTALRPKVAQFAQQHWCWQKCSQKYLKIFQELSR
jgi:glycosyltransferase involved in cell wall biosynthesis